MKQPLKFIFRLLSLSLMGVIILGSPFFLPIYTTHILIQILFLTFLCLGWNLVGGLTGQFSMGHPLFFAAGVYTPWLLNMQYDLSPWLGMWVAVALAILIGLFTGWIGFRYNLPVMTFALMTLALSHVGLFLIMRTPQLGGTEGITVPVKGSSLTQFQFTSKVPYYFIILAMVVGLFILYRYLINSKVGIYLKAIKQNERAAASISINVFKYKVLSLVISAALAAIGGTFAIQYYLYMSPNTAAGAHLWINVILICVIGGLGTLWGPLVGSAFFVLTDESLRVLVGQASKVVNTGIFGGLIIIVVTLMPEGVVGQIEHLWKRRKLRKQMV
jgi:branched-chain amino acid transport system permease protein